jgi:hypothetical protein
MVRLAQMSHIQLLAQFWYPLFARFYYDYHQTRRVKYAALAGLMVLGQIYSGIYLGLMLVSVLTVAFYWELRSQNYSREVVTVIAGVGFFVALAVLPLALPYYRMSHLLGLVREIDEARQYSAYVWSFLSPPFESNLSFLARAIPWGRFLHEKHLFVGFVAAGLAGVCAWETFSTRKKSYWARLLFAGLAFSVWMALGPNALLYAVFYYAFPGFKSLRCPARFGMVYLFFVAFAAAWGANHWLSRQKKGQALLLASVVLWLIWENHVRISLVEIPPYLKATAEFLSQTGDQTPLAHLPFRTAYRPFPGDQGNPLNNREAVRMYYGLFHSHPIANGYSGFQPPVYNELVSQEGDSSALFRALRNAGVGMVVLEKTMYPSISAAQSVRQGRACLYEDAFVCVFRI